MQQGSRVCFVLWLRADIAVSNVVFPTRSSALVREALIRSLVLVSESYTLCMKVGDPSLRPLSLSP